MLRMALETLKQARIVGLVLIALVLATGLTMSTRWLYTEMSTLQMNNRLSDFAFIDFYTNTICSVISWIIHKRFFIFTNQTKNQII